MIEKIKNKIRSKLRMFLGIDVFEENYQSHRVWNDSRVLSLERMSNLHGGRLSKHDKEIEALHNTVSNVVSIGVDHVPHDRGSSWAVVCIEGKYNVVKFVPLHKSDVNHMLDFLKQFEAGRHVIDTPYKFIEKDMLLDWNK